LLRATLGVLPVRIYLLVIVTLLALALLGHPLEVSAGWLVWPPVVYLAPSPSRSCHPVSIVAGWQWRARGTTRARLAMCRSCAAVPWSSSG